MKKLLILLMIAAIIDYLCGDISPHNYNLCDPLTALAIGSSLLSGIGSLFSSRQSASNQKSANATNLQLARLNNQTLERNTDKTNEAHLQGVQATNQMELEKQARENAFNLDMWNRQNAYNSAGSQKSRFLAAGINPALAMSGQGATEAGGLTSADANLRAPQLGAVAQTQAGHVDPVPAFDYGSVFSGSYQKAMQAIQLNNELQNSEANRESVRVSTQQKNVELFVAKQTAVFRIIQELNKMKQGTEAYNIALQQLRKLTNENEVYSAQMPELKKQVQKANELTDAQIAKAQDEMKVADRNASVNEARVAIERFKAQTDRKLANAQIKRMSYDLAELKFTFDQRWTEKDLANKTAAQQLSFLKESAPHILKELKNKGLLTGEEVEKTIQEIHNLIVERERISNYNDIHNSILVWVFDRLPGLKLLTGSLPLK